jgi:phosphomevalonate kinase
LKAGWVVMQKFRSSDTDVHVSVPGKLILLGEYAVLQGADALVMAVDRYALVKIGETGSDKSWQISSNLERDRLSFKLDPNGKMEPLPDSRDSCWRKMNFACQAIEAICMHLAASGFTIQPFLIGINTKAFYLKKNKKLGLGSSAALIIAIVFAIAVYHRAEVRIFPDKNTLFEFCFAVHSQAQGKRGSGIDVAAGVYGGIVQYQMAAAGKGNGSRRTLFPALPSRLNLLPVWTGKSTSTQTLLQSLEKYRSENLSGFNLFMKNLTGISNNGCQDLINKNIHGFLESVSEYYRVLLKLTQKSGIPIISAVHEQIARIVHAAQGYYKPSGAGEGDLGLVFSDSIEVLTIIREQLKQKNFGVLDLHVSGSGVKKI